MNTRYKQGFAFFANHWSADHGAIKRISAAFIALIISIFYAESIGEAANFGVVTIAVSRTPLSAPLYIAQAKGYFSDEGLNVVFDDTIGGHRCMDKVLAGVADFATASESVVMFHSFKRDDYAIVSTFVSSDNDVKFIARQSAGITTAADLHGKRIAVIKGTAAHFFLDSFLLFNHIKETDVTLVAMQPEAMVEALAQAQVDAIAVWEPYGFAAMQKLGSEAVLLQEPAMYQETFNLLATQQYLDTYPDIARKILQALHRAIDFIHTQPQQAQMILMQTLQLSETFIDWIWPDFNFALKLDQALLITLEESARWAKNQQLVAHSTNQIPNYLTYLYLSAMLAVDPEAVTVIH